MAEQVAENPILEAMTLFNRLSGEKISSLEEEKKAVLKELEALKSENTKLQGLVEEIQKQSDFLKKKNSELKEQLAQKTTSAAAVAASTKEAKKPETAAQPSVIVMTHEEREARIHYEANFDNSVLADNQDLIEDFGGLKKALGFLITGEGFKKWFEYSNGIKQTEQLQFLLADDEPICYFNKNEDYRIITPDDAKFLLEVIKVVETRRNILARATDGRY